MANAIIEDVMSETGQDLAAIVHAGCFVSEAEALREAVQTLLAVNPQLRVEAAIRRRYAKTARIKRGGRRLCG